MFTDVTVTAEGLGNVTVDITYGGAFYAVVPAGKVGLQLSSSPAQEFRNVANKLKGDTYSIFLLYLNTLLSIIVLEEKKRNCWSAVLSEVTVKRASCNCNSEGINQVIAFFPKHLQVIEYHLSWR